VNRRLVGTCRWVSFCWRLRYKVWRCCI